MDIRRIPKLDEEGFERLKNISAPGISWQRDVLAAHSEKRATARIVAGVEFAWVSRFNSITLLGR
jgi:hypothetical protein